MAQQQQSQAEEAIRQAQEEKLCVMAEEVGIDCTELNNLLHPIISSCTKDAISQGKAWILGKSQSNSMINPVIALQLLLRYYFSKIYHHCFIIIFVQINRAECAVQPKVAHYLPY